MVSNERVRAALSVTVVSRGATQSCIPSDAHLDNVHGHIELTTVTDGVPVQVLHDPGIERLIDEIQDVSARAEARGRRVGVESI